MKNDIETKRKLVELCIKVAEFNCVLSATGATIISLNQDSFNIGSLLSFGALGVNLGFLSYDAYQLYQLDKEDSNNKEGESKKLVKIKNSQIKE